jgi:hypothetical protein
MIAMPNQTARPLSADAVLRKSDRSAWQNFDQEVVLLDMPSRTLFGLNSVGGLVWDSVDGQRTLAEIARKVAERFEQAQERVLADVLHFAGELVARGCLEFSEP